MKRLLAAVVFFVASLAGVSQAQAQSLSASPSSLYSGQPVGATWSGIASPVATDWIGLYAVGAADNAFVTYVYTGGGASGSTSIGVPANAAAGTYELRLFANNGYTRLATSGAVTVQTPPPATLSASPSSLYTSQSVTATWGSIFQPSATDWVGLYAVGSADSAFVTYVYTGGGASGSAGITVPANAAAGTYELRLFSNNGYSKLATSGAVTVQTPPPATLSASPSSVYSSQAVTATWGSIFQPSATDWVGLYVVGAADNAFVAYVYTNGGASGSASITVPANAAAGTYQLRLFSNNGYSKLATSGNVTVQTPPPATLSVSTSGVQPGGSVTATWASIFAPSGTDWIGLFAPGAADNVFVSWRYTTGAAAGNVPVSIGVGVAPGTYQLRLFANNGYTKLATSANFAVGSAQLSFIHVDHLNTPRLIADASGTTVWKWDQQEPFGNDVPNQDPGNTGSTFDFPLRFPGQYADKETGLAYNYFRDYDPAVGGYKQSDPVGLRGGLNTYLYTRGYPTGATDRFGLRDVIVVVWERSFGPYPLLSAGHVFVGEMNGKEILSSFPVTIPQGPQTTRDWLDTHVAEWRAPDGVFRIAVPNDDSFDARVAQNRALPTWSAIPQIASNSTNCAVSAFTSLRSGGLPIQIPSFLPTPNDFFDEMNRLAKVSGSGVQKIQKVPW